MFLSFYKYRYGIIFIQTVLKCSSVMNSTQTCSCDVHIKKPGSVNLNAVIYQSYIQKHILHFGIEE